MNSKVTLDRAGRVALPKPLRDQMKLEPGDTLQLESLGEKITLRQVRAQALLKKELGIWVFHGESTSASLLELIDSSREKRASEFHK